MLNGIWKARSASLGGAALDPEALAGIEIVLRDGHYVIGIDRGLYTTDLTTSPHAIDVIGEEGPNAARHIKAIFALADGELTICYDLSGNERPTGFASTPGTLEFLVRYARIAD